jgi:hypothetical protein
MVSNKIVVSLFIFVTVLLIVLLTCNTSSGNIDKSILKNVYIVPEEFLRPEIPFKDFQKKRKELLTEYLLTTREKFKEQHNIGSVMTDGYHISMPENSMWKGGTIEISEEIGKEVEKIKSVL